MATPSEWIPIEWPAEWPAEGKEPAQAERVRKSPFNCVLSGSVAGLDSPAVKWRKASEIDWRAPGEVVAIGDAVWPELALKSSAGAESGPTGAPWLDANGWLMEMARSRAPGRAVWIRTEEERERELAGQLLAMCEARAYGGHRPLRLSKAQRAGAAEGEWRKLCEAAAWLKARAARFEWAPFARLLVVSDFSGPNELNATEVLNLASRRNLAYRVAEPGRLSAADLAGIRAVLYVDGARLGASQLALLQRFVESGGLLMAMKEPGSQIARRTAGGGEHPRFDLFSCGKGRVALSRSEWEDQWVLAQDAHLLMSRRNDALRLFNAGSLTIYHTVSPDRRLWLAHLLNYTGREAAHDVSLQSWQRFVGARAHVLGREPVRLEIHRGASGDELHLPPFPTYMAVEMELEANG